MGHCGLLLLGKHPERKREECGEVDLSMSSYIAGSMLRAILCELAELFVTTFSLLTILGSNDRQRELARKRLLFLYSACTYRCEAIKIFEKIFMNNSHSDLRKAAIQRLIVCGNAQLLDLHTKILWVE